MRLLVCLHRGPHAQMLQPQLADAEGDSSRMTSLIADRDLEGGRRYRLTIASFTLKPAATRKPFTGSGKCSSWSAFQIDRQAENHAIVTSYLQILHLDHEGASRELPNNGTSQGYRIHRIVVNRWELEEVHGQWMIQRRTILPVDGSPEPLHLLSQGLSDLERVAKPERGLTNNDPNEHKK